jgi:hypothetical protein
MMIAGAVLGTVGQLAAPAIGQAIGGATSIANGWGCFSTGLSIFGSAGLVGALIGGALMLVGAATMAFGANEIATAATGTNYIQKWTGMSDTAYQWTYLGLNLASAVGKIAGQQYLQFEGRTISATNPDGSTKQHRYLKNGNPNGKKLFDVDYNHPAYGNPDIKFPHYHGWTSGGIRATDHQSYFQMIWWLIKELFR